jgi:hypothetical protein
VCVCVCVCVCVSIGQSFTVRVKAVTLNREYNMALGYGLDDRDSRVRFPAEAGKRSHHRVQNLGPTQPPIQWVSGPISLGVKWAGREAAHTSI